MEDNRQERRSQSSLNQADHDTLIRVDNNLSNLLELVEYHRKDFKDHLLNDTVSFKAIGVELNNIQDDINRKHSKVMNVILPAIGGGSVILFLISLLYK